MGNVIVDTQMIGIRFMEVIFREAESLAIEKGLDKEKIIRALVEAPSQEKFMSIIVENFGDDLIILF